MDAQDDVFTDDDFGDILFPADKTKLDEGKLLQLKRDDPLMRSLTVFFGGDYHADNVDWGKEGGYIRTNTHLKMLRLYGCGSLWKCQVPEKMREFCMCLAGNTSSV